MNGPLKFLTNLIFPPKCVFCNNILEPSHTDNVCAECRLGIRYCKDFLCCVKCGKPVVSYGEDKKCYACLNTRHRFTRAASALIYEKNVRYAVIRNKKRCVKANIAEFARLMSLAAEMSFGEVEFDAVVSPPPSKLSLRKNGFDHIEAIAKELAETLGLPYIKGCLCKVRQTPHQSSLKYNQRIENLRGTMECRADMSGKTVLLADDVLTTGATADECARALKSGGAKKVYVVTLATAVKENL